RHALGRLLIGLSARASTATEVKLNISANVGGSDEIQFVPHLIQLLLLFIVQQQLIQGLIVAKVAHQVVEACAQVSAAVLGGIEIIPPPLLFVKHVREHTAKPAESRFLSGALLGGHRQIRITGNIFNQ